MELRQILLSMQTEVVCANRLVCDRSWANYGHSEHIDPFGRIYYLRGGRGEVFHHGTHFAMQPGFLYAIPAHTHSRYICRKQMDLSYIHYTADVLGSLEVFRALGWGFSLAVDSQVMDKLWDDLLACDPENPAQLLQREGLLRQILANFVDAPGKAESPLAELGRFRPVFDHIEQHLSEPLRLGELAYLLHLQPTYFSNVFSKFVGMPPMRYLLRRRVERAASWLWQGELRIGEIAQRLGFADIYHFSKTFRQITGLSPTAYRKQLRVEEHEHAESTTPDDS